MINIQHNRDGFFKYYTPEAAILTLEGGARKWSSPLLFNDPFDNQFDLDFPDPTAQLAAQIFENFFAVLNSPKPIRPYQFGSLTTIAEFVRQIRQADFAHQYTKDEITELKVAVLEGMKDVKTMVRKANDELRQIMLDTRILCVSERNDSILMWSHYAENHTGIVIKYMTLSETASPLRLAEPVRYSREMPRLNYDIMLRLRSRQKRNNQNAYLVKE